MQKAWKWKKKWQLFYRTELGCWLAVALALLVVVREYDFLGLQPFVDLFHVTLKVTQTTVPPWLARWSIWAFQALIIVVAFGTVYAALMELFSDRLSTNQQEIIFQLALKRILEQFRALERLQGTRQEVAKVYNAFVKDVLQTASVTFSSTPPYKRVDVGLMAVNPENLCLELLGCNQEAEGRYERDLAIPLPPGVDNLADYTSSGPAGLAHFLNATVYVPKKAAWEDPSAKDAWALEFNDSSHSGREIEYEFKDPRCLWKKCSQADYENFRTVVCVPVKKRGVRGAGDDPTAFDILNFSTQAPDKFTARDFFMAEFFATILGQAATIYEGKTLKPDQPILP